MRRSTKLIALGALGALAIPVPSHAVRLDASADIVKEVVVTAQVQKLGTTKKGTFSLTFREAQGVYFEKPPLDSQLDKFSLDPHIGGGIPSGGLPNFSGCMTLRIAGVVSQVNECSIYGDSASLEADPSLGTVSVSATMGASNDWRTSFSLNLEANDTPTQESISRTTEVRPTTKAGGGYELDAGEGIKREGILRGGIIYDQTPGVDAIVFIPGTESVTMRQYVRAGSAFDRQPVICGGGDNKGIVIGAANQYPDIDGDGGPDYIAVPAGCHPDDEIPDQLP